MTTFEKANENYNDIDNLILLLYERSIRHFSLILTGNKEPKESHNIAIGKITNLNLEELTKENLVKYVKSQNSILKKINIKERDYIDDLNTTKFIKKSGFNSYNEDIMLF